MATPETGRIGLTVGLTALLIGLAVSLGVVIGRRINPNRARVQIPSRVKRMLMLFGVAYLAAVIAVVVVVGLLTRNWIVGGVSGVGWMVILQMASVLVRAIRPRRKAMVSAEVPISKM